MKKSTFVRGIGDKDLSEILTHHTQVLRALSHATTHLRRQRAYGFFWLVTATLAIIYLAVTA